MVKLDPMRVASAYGFGEQPELTAWENLKQWAKPKGLLEDLEAHPIFGFNNPYPTRNTPKYGYVYWIKVGPDVEPEGNVRIEEFFGGTYAVQRCEVLGDPGRTVPSGWQSLAEWCKKNDHALAKHPALEQFLCPPDDLDHLVLLLHCPILA
ncbi:MAG: GyrI-like domain-containing protein [Methanothrix sp.]|nr:GyrI-like domain-containing protein [Methanothrix sp.]